MTAALLELHGLTKHYPVRRGAFGRSTAVLRAASDVSLSLARGEVLGLVGESGSGKTTVGQTVLRLTEPTSGAIVLDGTDIARLSQRALHPWRRRMQMVFQDPYASLNPRLTVGETLAEPLEIFGHGDRAARRERVAELLVLVGLRPEHATRYPHEFSGGQRQRIGIARALAPEPDLVVADEPVSALDVSVQAQIIALIETLRERLGLTMLLIAHDLAVVEHVSDRVAVMYLGRIVEIGPVAALYRNPAHPYTQALLSAVPQPRAGARAARQVLAGDMPSPVNPPSGCAFRTRCPVALPTCAEAVPPLHTVGAGHSAACIRVAP